MKKILVFLSSVVILFLLSWYMYNDSLHDEVLNNSNNPFGTKEIHPATIEQLNDPNYQNIIVPKDLEKKLNQDTDVTVYFYSPTCKPCKETTPIVVPMAKDLGINLFQFNLLEYENSWEDYGVIFTPTTIHFQKGKEIMRIAGYQSSESYLNFFSTLAK